MKNKILLIAFLLPLLSFAQRQALFIPVSDNISLKLSEGIKVYKMSNKGDTLFLSISSIREIYDQLVDLDTCHDVANIQLAQQVEYCLKISAEGSHVDLRNWLVAYTPWLSVPRSGDQYHIWTDYQSKPKPEKPEFEVNSTAFFNAIEAAGFDGKQWQKEAQRPQALYWSGSRLILKVGWEENGRSEKKIIVFVLPMGC